MEYKVLSTERNRTAVEITPTHPDGFFTRYDKFVGEWLRIGSITLRDLSPRHAKALEGGDTSVMGIYLTTEPDRPDLITFTWHKDSRAIATDPSDPTSTIMIRRVQELAPVVDAPSDVQPNVRPFILDAQ